MLFSCLFLLEKQALLRTTRSVLLLPLRFFLLSVLFLVRKGPLGLTVPQLDVWRTIGVFMSWYINHAKGVLGVIIQGPFWGQKTVVAKMITESIRFEPQVCICNGN